MHCLVCSHNHAIVITASVLVWACVHDDKPTRLHLPVTRDDLSREHWRQRHRNQQMLSQSQCIWCESVLYCAKGLEKRSTRGRARKRRHLGSSGNEAMETDELVHVINAWLHGRFSFEFKRACATQQKQIDAVLS